MSQAVALAANAAPPAAREQRDVLDLAATAALAVYSFVAALGFARVYADWAFVGDVALVVIVGHGLSYALRRFGVPGLLAVPLVAIGLAWVVAWISYPSTFGFVFPTRETWNIAWADLNLVRDQFRNAVAPVEYVGGWSLLATIGTAFAVLTADTFAFHARARGEALVPGAVLFIFVAALGADRHRLSLTLALVGAGFLAAAVLRVRFAQPPRTSLGGTRHPLSVALPATVVAGTAVVLGAWVLGPRLPGATADPLVDTHTSSGSVTQVRSPLVDIRTRLVNRADTELFTVTTTQPAYWRVSGLPEFDGNSWALPDRSLQDVDGRLSAAAPGSSANDQLIVISELRGKLVPSAAEPVEADGEGLRWNADTSTLLRIDRELETGDEFEIQSAMPSFTADALRAATSSAPPDPIYLELPENFPGSVRDLAATVTAGQTTTYDRMLTLQNWFQREFEYSLDVPQGHGTNAIEAFLRQRIGYCEQFAGTFAAMARSLGVPARVAVGYTPGIQQPDGTRAVLGKNSHAWPEVWFDELGWVPFEPTPGRGAPGAEGYTGLAADQDDAAPLPDTGGATPGPEVLPPVSIPGLGDDIPLEDPALTPNTPTGPTFTGDVPNRPTDWTTVLIVLAVLAAAGALPEVVRRWRRARMSDDMSREIGALWTRALGAVEAAGCRIHHSLTPLEQARAVAPRLPVAARPLKELAEVTTAATYAPPDDVARLVSAQIAGEPGPRRWCRQVERIAEDTLTTGGRIRRYFTVWT